MNSNFNGAKQELEIFEGKKPVQGFHNQEQADIIVKAERKSKAQRNLDREDAKSSSEASSSLLMSKSPLIAAKFQESTKPDKQATFKDYLAKQR